MKHRKSHTNTYAIAETEAAIAEAAIPIADDNDFAAREKAVRESHFTWAQKRIQAAYVQYGMTDYFIFEPLRWYLVFQAAWRLPNFHEFSKDLFSNCEALLEKLPANQQDRVEKFHGQLAFDPTRSLKHKWEDRGIPIYHFLNRAFAREWDNFLANEIKNNIQFVPISIVPDIENDMSVQNRIDAEISLGDRVEAPEPWFADDDYGAERQRQEKALVWNADIEALTHPETPRQHPGYKIGVPLWKTVRAFRNASETNEIIHDSIIELGRADHSKIARKLTDAGLEVNHDKVRRIVMKFESLLDTVRKSAENWQSKHNTCASTLPEMPTIEVPAEEEALREKRYKQEFCEPPRTTPKREKKQKDGLHTLPCGLAVRVMDPEEFDKIKDNRLVFVTTKVEDYKKNKADILQQFGAR